VDARAPSALSNDCAPHAHPIPMKLYWGPHTCAIGIHILLEEIGKPYTTEKLDVAGGEAEQPPFLAVNPKGKVPTIVRDDGSVLTEFGAIALWLARSNEDKRLVPMDADGLARAEEIVAYVEGTIHGQGFGRIFKPQKYEPQDVVHTKLGLGQSSVKHQGKEMVDQAFAIVDKQLAGKPWASGTDFGIADAALFYVERWAPQNEIVMPPNVQAHYEKCLARPTVQKVRALWGEA
jgi:glutathione S-transferase